MNKPIGVAVIGAGMAGRAHCAGYRSAPTLFDPPLPPLRYVAVIDADAAVGRVSADALAAYPPGIPNIVPGEEITAETVAFLQAVAASPIGYVRGALEPHVGSFRVVTGSGG